MAKDYIDYIFVEFLTERDRDVPLANKMLKLQEEVGEASQALLAVLGSANVSDSGDKNKLLEELCDVMNVTMDMINFLNPDEKELKELFWNKLKKWKDKR